jgi:hypothetical protein
MQATSKTCGSRSIALNDGTGVSMMITCQPLALAVFRLWQAVKVALPGSAPAAPSACGPKRATRRPTPTSPPLSALLFP